MRGVLSTTSINVTGDIAAGGYVTGKKSGAFAYLSAPAVTTITSAATYYPILGTFTNAIIENFTGVATPAIRYDGTATQYFEIDWHATLSSNHAACTVKCAVKKGGVLVTGSEMATLCKTAGELYTLSGTCVVSLATNEEIQLVVTSDNDTDEVTFQYYTTTINEFFD